MAKDFIVNIFGLSKSVHPYDFQLGENFFKTYGQETVENGKLNAHVSLDKKETFIEADFNIEGYVNLVCDRSLDEFEHPLSIHRKIVFKFGNEPQEVSDEIIIISHEQDKLDIGQFMYEFIALEIPIKKLHPRFCDEDDDNDGLVYSSSNEENNDHETETDPRWEALKKLK